MKMTKDTVEQKVKKQPKFVPENREHIRYRKDELNKELMRKWVKKPKKEGV